MPVDGTLTGDNGQASTVPKGEVRHDGSMKTAAGGHHRPIHLDSVVDIPGGAVGTDPYRRWGPAFRWPWAILDAFLSMGQSAMLSFDKRDVVVSDLSFTQEFYREGPSSASAADRRKMAIVTTIKRDGLDQFLRRMQIEQSTIGPVSAPSGKISGLQRVRASLRLWQDSMSSGVRRFREHGNRED